MKVYASNPPVGAIPFHTPPTSFPYSTGTQTINTIEELLGGKGANLARMITELDLNVPPGFTIPCLWTRPHKNRKTVHQLLLPSVLEEMKNLEKKTGKGFGSTKNPLLVSVRSGAPISMPGMMETILNVGLNDETVEALAALTNERFAWDSYRRFVQMFASTALGIDSHIFHDMLKAAQHFAGTKDLDVMYLKKLVAAYKKVVSDHNKLVPQDPEQQLKKAILAVFKSWYGNKAVQYRSIENISDTIGTAVNIQSMVFGNLDNKSATGVAFTRNPTTGENVRMGDFLINAQGEDVVDGSHNTLSLADMWEKFPTQAKQLEKIMARLELHYKDMCDIEFTIEKGKLYILQTRIGKRHPHAGVKITLDMMQEGLITKEEGYRRLSGTDGPTTVDDVVEGECVATGLAASPGRVSGRAVFSVEAAMDEPDGNFILVRPQTDPEDVQAMSKAKGILTTSGGMVSHAAVVARGWGKPCVVGCSDVMIHNKMFTVAGKTVKQGDVVTIDGSTGEVLL